MKSVNKMEEFRILVGIPVDEKKRMGISYTAPPNNVVAQCSHCFDQIWIGPTQKKLVETEPVLLLCPMCVLKKSREEGRGVKVQTLT